MSSSHSLLAYSSRPQRFWSEGSRLLGRCLPLLVTDERGRQLRDLLRAATVPVWIEGCRSERIRNVLVAIDPNGPALDMRRLLELGQLLGLVADAEVFALHAWDARGEQLLRQHISAGYARDYVVAECSRAASRFAELLRNARDIDAAHRLCERGEPRHVIERVARRRNIGAVVLGMSHRPQFARALLECTAARLANTLSCHLVVLPSAATDPDPVALPQATAVRSAP